MMKYVMWGTLLAALLFGCNTQTEDVPTPAKTIPEQPASPPQETPSPAPVVPQEVPVPTPPPVKLEVQEHILESLAQPKDTSLHDAAPPRQPPAQKPVKKVQVSGGVLTDDKAENLKDSVSGGEVKVDIKLD